MFHLKVQVLFHLKDAPLIFVNTDGTDLAISAAEFESDPWN